jgi:hypothetical protein
VGWAEAGAYRGFAIDDMSPAGTGLCGTRAHGLPEARVEIFRLLLFRSLRSALNRYGLYGSRLGRPGVSMPMNCGLSLLPYAV